MPRVGLLFLCFICSCIVHAQSSTPVGDAFATGNNCYTITTAQNWQLGAVWFNEQLNLSNPFEITLDVNFGSNDAGADGIVFIMQQVGLDAIGNPGGGMGFDGFAPSLGIEMDTFFNGDLGDIPQDHMGVFANGTANHNDGLNLAGPVTINPFGSNVEDGQDHIFKLVWDPAAQLLSVFFDCELRIQLNLDLVDVIFGGDSEVFWGFSGATGGENNLQTVCISEFALGLDPEVTVCDGESVQLGVVGAENGTYSWEPATYLDNPSIANPICTPDEAISYTVTFTDVCGEQLTLDTEVEVVSLDFSLPENFSFCENEVEQINVDNPNNYNLLWDGVVVDFPIDLTGGMHELLAESEGCQLVFTTDVEVLESPIIDWQEGYSACENESVLIDATLAGAEYVWQDMSTMSTYSSEESEQVSLLLTAENGCATELQSEIVVHPLPLIHLPEQIDLCEGEVYTLDPIEGEVVEWNTGESSETLQVSNHGLYSVLVESPEGCLNSDTSLVVVSPAPSIESFMDAEICDGETYTLNLDLAPDWNYFINGDALLDASLELMNEGIYTVVVSSEDGACQDQSQFEISKIESPEFNLPELLSFCQGDVFELQVDGLLEYTTFWNGEEQSIFQISSPGLYELRAENDCGVLMKEVEAFEEQCSCVVYTPNTFTPNNDGINDQFGVTLDCDLERYQLLIFNRWGQVVFNSIELGELWDGSMNGSEFYVEDEVYQWQLTGQANLPTGIVDVLESGFVVIIR